MFIDGHADFQHSSDEPNGEVASLDLALVTGRGPELLADLDGLRPLVRDEDVALVGYRVFGGNDHVSTSTFAIRPSRSSTTRKFGNMAPPAPSQEH